MLPLIASRSSRSSRAARPDRHRSRHRRARRVPSDHAISGGEPFGRYGREFPGRRVFISSRPRLRSGPVFKFPKIFRAGFSGGPVFLEKGGRHPFLEGPALRRAVPSFGAVSGTLHRNFILRHGRGRRGRFVGSFKQRFCTSCRLHGGCRMAWAHDGS